MSATRCPFFEKVEKSRERELQLTTLRILNNELSDQSNQVQFNLCTHIFLDSRRRCERLHEYSDTAKERRADDEISMNPERIEAVAWRVAEVEGFAQRTVSKSA